MKEDYTVYDKKPEAFINYLRYYGSHFSKKLCDFACKQFPKSEYTKEKLDNLLSVHNIELKGAKLHDHVFLANWCKYTLYGSSITDEKHLLLFLKDIFDKESELLFNRWYADMAKQGIPIEWDEML
jgi:hypothetical protein